MEKEKGKEKRRKRRRKRKRGRGETRKEDGESRFFRHSQQLWPRLLPHIHIKATHTFLLHPAHTSARCGLGCQQEQLSPNVPSCKMRTQRFQGGCKKEVVKSIAMPPLPGWWWLGWVKANAHRAWHPIHSSYWLGS